MPAKAVKKATKSRTPRRGKLRSMRSSGGCRAFVLEQLAGVKGLYARAMFGGVGLYAGEVFFGIIAADTLYLKTDDETRGAYEAAGMTAFRPYDTKPMTMPYHQVPANVLEDAAELEKWAARAVHVARTSRARRISGTRRTRS